jgi:flagellar basal body P-ring formation protein FlgA
MTRVSHLKMVVLAGICLPVAVGYSQERIDPNATESVWLQIHLPREVTAQQTTLSLGQISVIRGASQWVDVAGRIGLGRISLPGQKIVVDRATILSRLAASGIPSDKVLLTGADAVMVSNGQKVIDSNEFVTAGRQALREALSNRSLVEMTAVVKPKDLPLLTEPQRLQFEPRVTRTDARGLVTVQIRALADGHEVGVRDVPFRLKFEVRQAVTLKEIPPGTALNADNIKIEKRTSEQPEPANWKPPYGLVAIRTLAADQEIRADMLQSPAPATVIRRNEAVIMRIQRPGLTITATGQALEDGRVGEPVKVRNVDSSKVIVCKVNADGTVEPVL